MSIFLQSLNNDTVSLSSYLKFGDVNAVDAKGFSLLHYAAKGNSMEVANMLLTYNINVNLVDINGETPIFISIKMGLIGFTKLLIRHGANLRLKNNKGESLFMLACQKGSDELIELLIDNGAKTVDSLNINEENILFYLLKGKKAGLFLEIANKFPSLINQRDCRGINLLMLAVKYDFQSIVSFLLKHGISLYELDKNGNNALFYASKYASYEMMSFILSLKPIVNGKNNDGQDIFEFGSENTENENVLDLYVNSTYYITYKKTYPEFFAVIEKDYNYLDSHQFDKNKRDVNNTSLESIVNAIDDPNLKKLINKKA